MNIDKRLITFFPGEARGEMVFNDKCARCHSTPVDRGEQVFSNFEYFNIGVPANIDLDTDLGAAVNDMGLGAVTGQVTDNGKFRVPSLRNIADTAPYMHNGVFANLGEVVDFYNDVPVPGVSGTAEVSANLADGGQYLPFDINAQEKVDLIDFLGTLSDM